MFVFYMLTYRKRRNYKIRHARIQKAASLMIKITGYS
jgi:hypothetical protein